MILKWCGHEWLTKERWGDIHPDKTFCWYDSKAVEIDNNGFLHLKTKLNSKHFEDIGVRSEVGVGLVSCLTHFSFGSFEIECKLPTGSNLWPAFWLYSFQSWPPEIDIFEAYSNNKSSYFDFDIKNPLKFWNLKSCLHYGTVDNHQNITDKKSFFGFKNPRKSFIKYRCDWYPDRIDIFYNGWKVRSITDSEVLSQLNGKTMNVIINNSITQNSSIIDFKESDFIIKYFKYTKFNF